MQNISGRIHSYESFSTLDGPGVRFVVFLQGCPLRCVYCHNPDTWACDAGELTDSATVVDKIERCRNFLRNGGATLSGGEPMLQKEFCLDILQRLRAANIHAAVDTAGSLDISFSAPIIDAADLILLDIKAPDSATRRAITGVDNAHALDTLAYCEAAHKDVWIRHVLVPGYTLDDAKLRDLATLLRPYTCVKNVALLPFHKRAAFKWQGLGLADPLAATPEPTADEVRRANEIFNATYLP